MIKIMESTQRMKFDQFKEQIKLAYYTVFPDSFVGVDIRNGLNNNKYILIRCYLSDTDNTDLDMFNYALMIDLGYGFSDTVNGTLPSQMKLQKVGKLYIITKPLNGNKSSALNRYDKKQVPFRAVTGDANKIIQAFSNAVDSLYDTVVQCEKDGLTPKKFASIVNSL